jgi:glutathione S-transferase
MRAEPIYHLAVLADWDDAAGEYRGSTLGRSLDEVGFVHCSTASQVRQVADLLYSGRDDVVLLKIDPGRLSVPVLHEKVGGKSFPHIYGPVPREAVISATPLRAGGDGRLEIGTIS